MIDTTNISIDLRRLRFFLAVAEELHFRRAAARLHISQPPLSAAIRGLEEDLGVVLFKRTTRRVSMTPAGRVLADEAIALFSRLRQTEELVKRVGRGEEGVLSVGFIGISTVMGLPQIVRRYREQFPSIALRLEELPSATVEAEVRAGGLDVGFLRSIDPLVPPLDGRLFVEDPYHVALPEGHRLAARKSVSLSDLDGEPLLFFPRSFQPRIHDTWITAFHTAKVTPNLIQEIRTHQTELTLVAAAMGIALVPASAAAERREGVAYRPLEADVPPVRVYAAWHRDRLSPAVARFVESLGESVDGPVS
jgi:DNA-binding transcriptional LysR family regulator